MEIQDKIIELRDKLKNFSESETEKKLDTYFALHRNLAKIDFAEALEVAKNAEIEAIKTKDPQQLVKAGNWKNIYFAYLGKKEIALKGFQKLITFCEENNLNLDKANLYGNIANCLDDYDKKLFYLLKAIESAKQIEDKQLIAHNLRAIGELDKRFTSTSQNSIQYYLDAIKIYEELQDNTNLAKTLAALGGAYGALANFDEGAKAFNKARKYADLVNEDWLSSIVYSYQMDFYFTYKKYNECLEIGYNVLPVFQKINDKIGERWVYYTIGRSHFEKKALKKATEFFYKAKEIDLVSDKFYVIEVNNYLEKIAVQQNNIEEAFRLTKETLTLEREKLDEEKNKAIAKMQTQFNTERKEKENLELRLKALRSQMNPHFIFNSLNSIQNFVVKNESEEAVKYISKFSLLMRQILNASEEKHISLEDEISFLENYLLLEKLRFKNRFDYKINLDNDIDPTFIDIPSMLIQPYVENAIVHGMKNKKKDGLIAVSIKKGTNENYIICEVEDNGEGIKLDLLKEKKHKSLGSHITKERIKAMRKGLDFNVEYSKLNNKDNTGTQVKIEIPII